MLHLSSERVIATMHFDNRKYRGIDALVVKESEQEYT